MIIDRIVKASSGLCQRVMYLGVVATVVASVNVASAAPQRYELDQAASEIKFIYRLSGSQIVGELPVVSADVVLDFEDVRRSKISVVMGMAQVRAGVFFATDAIKSASVLNTAAFPQAIFVSRKVRGTSQGVAEMQGELTLRGVTRPFTMEVQFYRQTDSTARDMSKLLLRVRGSLLRSQFGATGFPDLVGDRIDLDILVYIER